MRAMLSGLSVLTPSAWWALLAVAIPLLIHLFSRGRGRLVHIGHIDLIRRARKVKVTEIRLTQWLLLLLRMGIFLLATLILAGLVTAGLDSSNAPTVYLTPGWVQSSSPTDRSAIFDAVNTGPESRVFLLQPGFPRLDRPALDAMAQPALSTADDSGDTWSLLAERLSLERHQGAVTVYATDRLTQFGHDKPALPGEVAWRISHPGPAAAPGPVGIRALIAYDRDRSTEARLFDAAFTALKAQRLPGLRWESIEQSQPGETPADIDWLIRLGNDGPDLSRITRPDSPLVILSDAAEDGDSVPGQLISLPFYPFSQFRLERLGRNPLVAPGLASMTGWQVLLSTAGAAPVLQEARVGRVRILQFNSRFDPSWSSLAQQADFPELLLQLMLDPAQDVRRFTDARVAPADLSATMPEPASETPLPHRSLQGLLAVLLVIFWVTERWLSERRPREGR